MERTINTGVGNLEEPIVRWKKIGGGSLYLGTRIIKEDEVFKARASEIPEGFKDVIILVDNTPQPAVNRPPLAGVSAVYTKKPNKKDDSLFDVVNDKGKVLNSKGLTEENADQLINDLSA
jgi:hypothetical protein